MSYLQITFEILRFLTPFILAGIVYLFWHKQKGKEVVASESKNIISQVNGVMDLSETISDLILKEINNKLSNSNVKSGLSKDELIILNNELKNFELKIKSSLDSIDFLDGAINNESINLIKRTAIHRFYAVYDEYNKQIINLEVGNKVDIDSLLKQREFLFEDSTVIKNRLFQYALFKF